MGRGIETLPSLLVKAFQVETGSFLFKVRSGLLLEALQVEAMCSAGLVCNGSLGGLEGAEG